MRAGICCFLVASISLVGCAHPNKEEALAAVVAEGGGSVRAYCSPPRTLLEVSVPDPPADKDVPAIWCVNRIERTDQAMYQRCVKALADGGYVSLLPASRMSEAAGAKEAAGKPRAEAYLACFTWSQSGTVRNERLACGSLQNPTVEELTHPKKGDGGWVRVRGKLVKDPAVLKVEAACGGALDNSFTDMVKGSVTREGTGWRFERSAIP